MEIVDSENVESSDALSVAEQILGILETRKTLIYCFHTLLDQFELHLDSITKKYKAMTITLLLATFAGVGFLFSVETKEFQINKLILTGMICLFGIIGIYSIWYLDIQVFHKFWGSFFVEEVRMEKKFPFLIDIGDVSISLDHVKARILGNGNFYISIIAILIITMGIAISFIFESLLYRGSLWISTVILVVIVTKFMIGSCKKLQIALEKLLSVEYGKS